VTLRKGWQSAPLGDVCRIVSGGTPKTGVAAYWDGGIPWLTPKDMSCDRSQVLHGGQRAITPAGLGASSAQLFPAGSVIVSSRAPIGYVAIAGRDMAANQGCKIAVPPDDVLDSRYLYWFLLQAKDDLQARASGTTFKEISAKEFARTVLRWPALEAQRRIVDLLEDQLSRLHAAACEVGTAQVRGSTLLRRLLLDAALGRKDHVRVALPSLGRLDWAGPREPAVALPSGWRWLRWRDVGQSQNGRAFPSADYQEDGVRLLRPGNLGMDGKLAWKAGATKSLPERYTASHPDLLLTPGDLVMNLTAQSLKDDFLGRVCLVREGDEALLNQRLARLVPEKVSSDFAMIVFRSPVFRAHVASLNTGSLIQHMFTKQIAQFWMPVPPPAAQAEAVARLDGQAASWARTEHVLEQVPARAESLGRSLLSAALSGQLAAAASDVAEFSHV